jgi:hypothetical protein
MNKAFVDVSHGPIESSPKAEEPNTIDSLVDRRKIDVI